MITMTGVEKTYRLGNTKVQALKGVNLSIKQGELLAIWGPSGSGKTTLLNLIGAIDDPTQGEIHFKGQNFAHLTDNKRSEVRNQEIGFIFQGFNLVPVLTALENVMLPLHIRGLDTKKARDIAMSRLQDVGLENIAKHRPDKLSGGQQQRVSIARALSGSPQLVIADEPTANLDSVSAMTIISLLHELNEKEETTFVFSTHDQRLLDKVQRLVKLEDGKINGGESHDSMD